MVAAQGFTPQTCANCTLGKVKPTAGFGSCTDCRTLLVIYEWHQFSLVLFDDFAAPGRYGKTVTTCSDCAIGTFQVHALLLCTELRVVRLRAQPIVLLPFQTGFGATVCPVCATGSATVSAAGTQEDFNNATDWCVQCMLLLYVDDC
jgi:hypothetical protein